MIRSNSDRKMTLESRIARLEKMLKNEGNHDIMANLRRLLQEATGCKVLVLFDIDEPRNKSARVRVYCGSSPLEYRVSWEPSLGYEVNDKFLNERTSCDTEEEVAEVITDSVNQA